MVIATTIVTVYLIGVFLNILGIAHLVQMNVEKIHEHKPPYWAVLFGMRYDIIWWISWIGVVYYIFIYNKRNE